MEIYKSLTHELLQAPVETWYWQFRKCFWLLFEARSCLMSFKENLSGRVTRALILEVSEGAWMAGQLTS